MNSPRICYVPHPDQLADPAAKIVDVVQITDRESGYRPTDYKFKKEFAESHCERLNEKLGVSKPESDAMLRDSIRLSLEKADPRLALKQEWSKKFQPLVGRTIANVRYLSPEEMKFIGWHAAAVVLTLDDGTLLFPKADDEGNRPGALALQEGSRTKGIPNLAGVI